MTTMTNEIRPTAGLRRALACRLLLLLLLLTAGAGGAWGQTTTEKTYFYQENFSGDRLGGWTSGNTGRYTVSNTNGYMEVAPVDNGNNGTTVSTSATATVPSGVSYILQFDIKIKGGDNQQSTFRVNDINNSGYVLHLTQAATSGDDAKKWYVNESATSYVNLETTNWYRFKVHQTYDKTYLTVIERGTDNSADGSTVWAESVIAAGSTDGGLGRMVFETKRYNSSLCIDNVSVQKWGFDVTEATVSLTAANNDNKVTTCPTLYNPDDAALTYSYDGTVLSTYGTGGGEYYPRIKTTGTADVVVNIDDKKAGYRLTVTSATGGGTYDPVENRFTFTDVGKLTSNTVSSVFGLTMTADGGPTAVVVEQNLKKVLKIIDVNGFSHPFNTAMAYPTMGTYYKFVPSVPGRLTVYGNFESGAVLHTSSSKVNLLSGSDDTRTATLAVGNTYYLYNGSNMPLLNYFQYTPTVTSLMFRNPSPLITVDVAEGSYTNPALSAGGYPITYSVVVGDDIADVDANGKVTFKGDYFTNPKLITVIAESNGETVAYSINLAKNTWIFNDSKYWTTTASSLTGGGWDTNGGSGYNYTGNGLDGSAFCRNTTAINYAELTTNGTAVMPETRGLLFSKAANNDRLYIAPSGSGFSKNFLAMRATTIAIDDVQAGQTITVNWTGNSQAVLDLADAANENVTGKGGGTLQLTATQTGRFTIVSNPTTSYINSISISTPTRAIGTLTYAKNVLAPSSTESLTGFTITDEAGITDLSSAYNAPGNFKSSATGVVTVDANGKLTTGVATGTAVITATATAKNSVTHQGTVTLVALVEVVDDGSIRIRTINVADLLYNVPSGGISAGDGLVVHHALRARKP